jgi:hypothetical protein
MNAPLRYDEPSVSVTATSDGHVAAHVLGCFGVRSLVLAMTPDQAEAIGRELVAGARTARVLETSRKFYAKEESEARP